MEKNYIIKIYNGSDALVYDREIQAENENDALIMALKYFINIYNGDTIKIEEKEN